MSYVTSAGCAIYGSRVGAFIAFGRKRVNMFLHRPNPEIGSGSQIQDERRFLFDRKRSDYVKNHLHRFRRGGQVEAIQTFI